MKKIYLHLRLIECCENKNIKCKENVRIYPIYTDTIHLMEREIIAKVTSNDWYTFEFVCECKLAKQQIEAYLSIWNFIIENREEIYPREPPIPTRRNKILAITSLPVQRSNK